MLKLPIGIEDFEEIRTEGFYYVDKTGLITELLHPRAQHREACNVLRLPKS